MGRIYIDLAHARLGTRVRNLAIRDNRVEGVRLGQFKPDVVRVVVDTDNIKNYTTEALSDPDRLVISIRGEKSPQRDSPERGDSLHHAPPAAALNGVTHSSGPDSTRIVLKLDRSVTWLAGELAPGEGRRVGRIYIDLAHARLGTRVRNLAIRDNRVEGVRLGQFKPDVVRVVVDTDNIKNYTIEALSDPDRLVISIRGEKSPQRNSPEREDSLHHAPPAEISPQTPGSATPAAAPAPTQVPAASTTARQSVSTITRNGTRHDNRRAKDMNGLAETLLLDVTVNTQRLPEIQRVEMLTDGRLALPLESWQAARLRAPEGSPLVLPDDQTGYALESVAGLTYNLDRGRQALTITAPAVALTGSAIDGWGAGESPPNLSPPGIYFNYDVSAHGVDSRYEGYGAFVEGVVFNRWGCVVAGATLHGDRQNDAITRADTFWRMDLPGPMETLVLGDTIGSGGAWSRPVRYAGVRWARDFSLRPGFVTMPMPSLSGSAALPSTIDVLINNQLQHSARVDPGPFDLADVPVVGGAGEINLIVRDLLGRETVLSQSYYLSPRLLASGLADFSLEAGFLRENFGSEGNDYGAGFGAGTWRYGLTAALTGEVRVELQQERQAAGLELTGLVGTLGSAQAAAAIANVDGVLGGHYLLGLERASPRGGGSLRWEYYDRDYSQFAALPDEKHPRQQYSASLGMPLFKSVSIGVNYTGRSTWDDGNFSLTSVNLGVSLPWSINLSAYASKRLDNSDGWSGGAGLSIPLGSQVMASARSSYSGDGRTVETVDVSQSPPSGPGFGWRLGASDDTNQQWKAGLTLNTNVGTIHAEVRDGTKSTALQLGANGSFGLLNGLPFATRSIGQGSFAVVKVGDMEGVPVYRSNQLAATTNGSGLALVPGLLPYQKNQITIDPVELPFDVEIRGVEEMALPYARSGVVVEFPVRRSRNALVVLLQSDGKPVPAAARVMVSPGERQYIVAKRGEVYLTDLVDSNRLSVQWPGGACILDLPLDPNGPSEPRIGPLTCGDKQ